MRRAVLNMNNKSLIRRIGFLAIFLMTSGVFSQQVLDRVVAIVDDAIILESEIIQNGYLMALQDGLDPVKNPQLFEKEFAKYKTHQSGKPDQQTGVFDTGEERHD
jgi:tRNA U34 5-methylaminomethyl-2-thiouridine-forming methyltransferase MnmC